MKIPTFQKMNRFSTALFSIASLAAISTSHASVLTNASFESGTSGWVESGGIGVFSTVSQLSGAYADVDSTDGSSFGLLSNNGVSTASVSQTFDITNSALTLDYRFASDEYNTGVDYNDFARVLITIGGNTTTLVTISRNNLQAGGQGSLLSGASFLDNTQSGFDIGQSAWQSLSFDVSSHLGESATLTFELNNVGGNDPDIGVSQLAFDKVGFSAVPEPSSSLLVTAALGLIGVRRRR